MFSKINNKIISVLSEDLILKKYRKNTKTLSGYCYVVAEAIYHTYGKDFGYLPYRVKDNKGNSHWYLQNEYGIIIDLIGDSYKRKPFKYENGKRAAFLTKEPSKRCKIVLERIK